MNIGLVQQFANAQARLDPDILQKTNPSALVPKFRGQDATLDDARREEIFNPGEADQDQDEYMRDDGSRQRSDPNMGFEGAAGH